MNSWKFLAKPILRFSVVFNVKVSKFVCVLIQYVCVSSLSLSESVLQGFSCTSAQAFPQNKVKGLVSACRPRAGRGKVLLKEAQVYTFWYFFWNNYFVISARMATFKLSCLMCWDVLCWRNISKVVTLTWHFALPIKM